MSTLKFDVNANGAPFYEQAIDLEGASFVMTFKWNERTETWAWDLTTSTGENIVAGQTISLGRDMCERSVSLNKPKGKVVFLSSTASVEGPTLTELGSRVALYYYESAVPK